MNRIEVIKEIDHLLQHFCEGCFLKTHFRNEYSKTYAHQFCLTKCTVGENIQKMGKQL